MHLFVACVWVTLGFVSAANFSFEFRSKIRIILVPAHKLLIKYAQMTVKCPIPPTSSDFFVCLFFFDFFFAFYSQAYARAKKKSSCETIHKSHNHIKTSKGKLMITSTSNLIDLIDSRVHVQRIFQEKWNNWKSIMVNDVELGCGVWNPKKRKQFVHEKWTSDISTASNVCISLQLEQFEHFPYIFCVWWIYFFWCQSIWKSEFD